MADDETFEALFRREYRPLVRVAMAIVGDLGVAEELVQEGFAKAAQRWGRVARLDRPGAWVRRVVIRDAVRAGRARSRLVSTPAVESPAVLESASDDVLRRMIAGLPGQQRAAIALYYFEDRPTAEVADLLGCSEATVRVHLSRARAALSARFEAEEARDAAR